MTGAVIHVRSYEPELAASWADYVGGHPDGTFFHELAWKSAVETAFGHRAQDLIALRGRRIVGVLPMFQIESVIAGRMLVSQPYATYGGVLADDAEASAVLIAEAQSLMRRCGARVLELRSIRAASEDHSIRRSHATYIRDLPRDPRLVDVLLPRKARAAARKAVERSSLTVEFGRHLLRDIWRLYIRSMRKLGSPNYPLRFFEAIDRAASGRVVSQMVRCDGVPVAGLLTFVHRGTVMPYFVGMDDRREIYGLSQYVYVESMRHAVSLGCERYDFGRSRIDNTGACAFKRGCGFEPRVLEYQDIVPKGSAAPDLAPSSPRWRAARHLWRKLPLGVTRPLGSWLARSIPG